jgi:hypothetical protein
MLGDKEGGTLLAVGSGAWRVAPRANAASGTERTFATEVVIVPAVRVPHFEQKTTPMPGEQGSLAQNLQRELARVGCLPIHQPDGVLLALVQSQRVTTCGASCPSGQGLTDDGRCVPTAILSREALKDPKKAILATSSWSTTTVLAPNLTSSPIEGKMALAGPKAEGSAGVLKTEPVQPTRDRPPIERHSGGRDWRSELWKRLPN